MTIRHLKIFITVVDCGKMRQAADKLFISQPSVSQAVAELERHYGVKLFERLGQKLYLTEVGEKLVPYARHLVDSFEAMDLMMKNTCKIPTLRIGSSVSVGTYLLNHLLESLEASISPIDFEMLVHNTATIEEMIKTSQLDVGIVEGYVSSAELITCPVCEDELVIIVGKGHAYFDRPSIELEELDGQAFISREEGSSTRNQYEQLILEKGYKIKRKWYCTNTETIKQVVGHGRGLAIISKKLIEKEVKEGSLRILEVNQLKVSREIKLIYHKNKFLSKPLQKFIQLCQSVNT